MRVLLDTNILIHREASRIVRGEIGVLFRWLDRLQYEKCVHPLSVSETEKHQDPAVVETFRVKLDSYHRLQTVSPDDDAILELRRKYDRTDNDHIDTSLVKEVYAHRVDILITEDRAIHKKARLLGIGHKVFTIDDFLEKITAEHPSLADYHVLSVKKEYFGNIDVSDRFFDSFRRDYDGFDRWFSKKSDEIAYVCRGDNEAIVAFLYLKLELQKENYADLTPPPKPARRLKIGTFKVISNGFKLGERFLKIIFDNALILNVDEVYVTIFDKTVEQRRLIDLLRDRGYKRFGIKRTKTGAEVVLVRNFAPEFSFTDPRKTYPYMSATSRQFIVPIYPAYHTELLPDSILNTESPLDFVESRPNRNAISKVYISRSVRRDLERGDMIVFYRTASGGAAYYTSVTTTLGIVQDVITNIPSERDFIDLCRKRSVFSDQELAEHWNYRRSQRPFIVNFLYTYSLPRRMNRKALLERGVIGEAPPRGFELLSNNQFGRLLEGSNANQRLIVD